VLLAVADILLIPEYHLIVYSCSCVVNCQGLHDILAVIVWVVHCDHVAWRNADESAQSVGFVFDLTFILSSVCILTIIHFLSGL